MASVKNYNLFLLPKRHSSFKTRDEFTKKNIKQWIDGLPLGGDPENSAFDLYGKLDRLNRLELSPANRFEILELIEQPLEFVLGALKRECAEGEAPLNIKRRMVADLRLDILIQAVKAYKTVLSQFHDATITGLLFHKHTRSKALRNALFYLGESILHSYLTYQPCLQYAWKELHGIYYYSVINELQTPKDIVANTDHPDQIGIDGLYKQMLLLALANPNAMLCGEVERVYDILKKWVSFVDLVPIKSAVTSESFFLIDAQSDGIPCAPNLCRNEMIRVGWYLITDELEKTLAKKVAVAEAAQASMRPTDAGALRLMKRLKDAWSQQIRSRELRSRSSGVVELICGLDSLHLAHGGQDMDHGRSRPSSSDSTRSTPGHHIIDSPILDNDEVLIEVKPGVLELHRSYEVKRGQPERAQHRVGGKECIASNRSENGYGLNWPDSGDGGTRVGELVGLNPINGEANETYLSLGVVRWMSAEQPGFMGMGIELLHGKIEPVILQRSRKGVKQMEYIKGFLQHDAEEDSLSLIAPPLYVTKEDRYTVVTGNEEIPVDLINIVDSTDSFVRFKFEQLSINA